MADAEKQRAGGEIPDLVRLQISQLQTRDLFVMNVIDIFDHGIGELSDAAAALDWLQTLNRESRGCWIAGFSFGAWIGMQLLMRRPEVEGFISVAPPENLYDFSFLAPCPSSGLIIHGDKDRVAPPASVQKLVDKHGSSTAKIKEALGK